MVRLYIILGLFVLSASANELGVIDVIGEANSDTTSTSINFLSQSEQKMNQLVIQESSPGVYNPIKEGLQGDKILLDVNGIRMTNALFRSGPNQYFSWIPRTFVSEIQEDTLSRLMLNNSMGGEINQQLGIRESYLSSSYNTNNNAFDLSAGYSGDKISIGMSWIDTDNIKDTKGEVPYSNYNQKAFYANTKEIESNDISFLISQSNDIPRTDHYAKDDPYDYELQRYIFLSDSIDLSLHGNLKLSFQSFEEDINESSGQTTTINNIYSFIYSYALTQNLSISLSDYYEDIKYNDSRFNYNTLSIQTAYEHSLNNYNLLMAYTFSKADISGDITNDFVNHSGLLKLSYANFYASIVQGYRFPSIINLAKSIITEKGIDIANENLKPESSTTFTLAYNSKQFFAKVYYRILDNLITRELLPGLVDGLDAYETINAKDGEMYGAIVGSNIDFNEIKTSLYLEYTYGKTYNDYISKITPFHATAMLEYKNFYTEYLHALKAKNMSEADNRDIRIVGHNNGYDIVNIGYRYIKNNHELKLRVNNIFNSKGRVYASSVDWKRRNLSLEYKYYF